LEVRAVAATAGAVDAADPGAYVIELQGLTPADWQLWRTLRHRAPAEAPAAFGSTLAEWSGPADQESRWRARLSDVPLNIVCRLDGDPAGMVSARVADNGAVELISLWVAPGARGRGVGDVAVRAVLDWAGRRPVELSVKIDNAAAIALYRRHGFRTVAEVLDDAPDEQRMRLDR
jgi:ribosomal protein S18 acetylase RimI-like enzyme